MTVPFEPLDAGLLRSVFDQMLEGVQIVDDQFRYVYVNDVAARHGHRSREGLLGRRMQDLYPGIEQTEMFGRLAECLQGKPQHLLNHFEFPDGTEGWFELCMTPSSAGAIILSLDVTALKRNEESLQRTVRALEGADRRNTDMIGMLAHELRNPLTPLHNALHLLRSHLPEGDETAARAAETMERQLRHITRFVDDLNDVKRLESRRLTLARERLDLGHLASDVAEDGRAAFDSAGLTLRAEIPAEPLWVSGDKHRLAQVLGNVLENARKFTPRPGSVSLTLARRGADAEIEIRDTGIGMTPETISQVFDPLFQADRSLERTRGGMGIGLTVSRGLVDLHGGTIAVASDGRGRGTSVRITFPLAADASESAAPSASSKPRPGSKRVVLIEDNRDAADTMAMILELWGYEVRTAHTGTEGLALALDSKPDIVLCDIGLPGIDGYSVARALRANEAMRDTTIIAITAYGGEEDRARALAAGFDLHLPKPVEPELLKRQLEAA